MEKYWESEVSLFLKSITGCELWRQENGGVRYTIFATFWSLKDL